MAANMAVAIACMSVPPCLTRTRAGNGGHYILPLRRWMTVEELEALQGFPRGALSIPAGASKKHYAAMLGNAFTVSVVGRVALALLKTTGVVRSDHVDVWAAGIV